MRDEGQGIIPPLSGAATEDARTMMELLANRGLDVPGIDAVDKSA